MSDLDSSEILGTVGKLDPLGIASFNVPYHANTLDDVYTVGAGRILLGLPEKSRSFQSNEDGSFTVTALYEGQAPPGTGGGGGEPQVITGIKSTYQEVPIEAHPDLNTILQNYAGYVDKQSGRAIFNPNLSDAQAAGAKKRGMAKVATDTNGWFKNPFFGVEKYMVLDVTFTRTYASGSIPGDLLARSGKIVAVPPGNPPTLPNRTKWLVMPPEAQQRGNVFQISESYWLMREDTPPELYKHADPQ